MKSAMKILITLSEVIQDLEGYIRESRQIHILSFLQIYAYKNAMTRCRNSETTCFSN